MDQAVECLPAMWETQVRSLGWEDHLEKATASHSSTLAWKIPWTEEPGRLQSMGSQRVRHDWATSLSFYIIKLVTVSLVRGNKRGTRVVFFPLKPFIFFEFCTMYTYNPSKTHLPNSYTCTCTHTHTHTLPPTPRPALKGYDLKTLFVSLTGVRTCH